MKCPRCQQETPSDADFCPECGANLAVVCSGCGTTNAPTHKFCTKCGDRLGSGGGQGPAGTTATPASYMPKHLAEKILTSKAALEGERKQVTVLFADLKGSMELLADRDPEEARRILDPVLERMMEAVHRYEGTVNQVMGDGIMALFGAPLAHEDHAVRACYAAIRMQESVKQYGEGLRRSHGVEVQIRVGLNSGDVVVRSIGSDLHMYYTAVGQTTHLAARMEQIAEPGSVVFTAETFKLVRGYVEANPLGRVSVKGLGNAVEVYRLAGLGPVRTRLQAMTARGFTRFVGRDAEMAQLRTALDRAEHHHGQIVAVVGDAGVGKSRLLWEFAHSGWNDGWLILASGAVSYGKSVAYLPLTDLLRMYFQIEPHDETHSVQERVARKLLALDRALEPLLPALLSLLDAPIEDEQALDPPQRRQRTLEAIRRLLLRESQMQPLLVVVEDLHWVDSETQALLDGLVETLPTARLLVLVSYRPEYQHAWGSRSYYRELHVGPLPDKSAEDLLHALLGEDSDLRSMKRLLIERTEGNPFFLEESVRALVETQVLVGVRGAYRLSHPLETIQVPPTVQAVLAARIDRLAPSRKTVLQTAAIIGRDVPFVLLATIVDGSEEELRGVLVDLQAAEFLYETGRLPELEYRFKHALTHEVAYSSLLVERRRALHAKIVDTVEHRYADRLAEHVDRLAYHALRGEVWRKAVSYCRQAGVKAARRSSYREAIVVLERAVEALARLPGDRAALEEAIDIRFAIRSCLWALGEFDRIVDHLREADRMASTLGDPQRLRWCTTYLSAHFWVAGDHRQAVELAERAIAMGATDKSFTLQMAESNLDLALAQHALGEYEGIIDRLAGNLRALEEGTFARRYRMASFYAVISHTLLAWTWADLGQFRDALATAETAVAVAEASGRPISRAYAYYGAGCVHAGKGDLADAIASLERAVGVCREVEIPALFPLPGSLLGHSYAMSGRLTDALPLLRESMQKAAAIRLNCHQALREARLAEACLLADDRDDARAHGLRALESARFHGERGNEAWALRLLGDVTARRDLPDLADVHYRDALALAEELRMRPLIAHCHFGLSKLYRRTDKRERAREHLATATAMYRDMGMTYWLEKAEAEKPELGR
jgi:class 3 adenylate cyclase/tetratricopeptide (TPR) repeat protein